MTPAGIFAPFILDARGVSHIGHVREENQDDYLVDAGAGLFAVADGVGGLKDGRHASRTVIEALTGLPGFSSLNELRDNFEAGVARANHALRLFVRDNGSALGTTLAALLVHDHAILCAWAGDSRIYRLRGQALTLLTDDHTEAAELLRQGTLTPEEARVWPRRNVITRAIGVEDTVDLDYKSGSIQPGDIYLLCSDGLTTHLSDAEILTAISGRSLDEAAEALIGATLREGASDNVTVILVGVHPASPLSAQRNGTQEPAHGGRKAVREQTVQLASRKAHHGG